MDIRETENDALVTDITPSSSTFKGVTAQSSSASVSTIVMSDTTAVIGAKGIDLGQYQINASNATALTFSEATVHLAVATAADAVREAATVTFTVVDSQWLA